MLMARVSATKQVEDPNYEPMPYEEECKDINNSYSRLWKLNFQDKAKEDNIIQFDSESIGLCKNGRFKVLDNLGEGGQGYTLKCVKVNAPKKDETFVIKVSSCKRWKQVPNE